MKEAKKACRCEECSKPLVRWPTRTNKYFCDIACKSAWQKRAKPVTKEWLEEQYLVNKLDCVQIAALVKRDPKSVWNWMKDFGIPCRPRGSHTAVHFKKGQPNAFAGRKHTAETRAKLSAHAIATGRVPFSKESGPRNRGKKGAETNNWKGGFTPERQAVYSSPDWKKAVVAVWKRDNATCQRCKKHKSAFRDLPFDIHHIAGFAKRELRCDAASLVLLCEPCHYWVHGKQNEKKEFLCP